MCNLFNLIVIKPCVDVICVYRLAYRSKQRGFLELDLVLGNWVDENIHSMDETAVRSLIDVLNLVCITLIHYVVRF